MLIGPDGDRPPRAAKQGKKAKAKARKDRSAPRPGAEPLVPEPAPDAGTGFSRPAVWPLIPEPGAPPDTAPAGASPAGPPSDGAAPAVPASPTPADASPTPADVPTPAAAPEDALALLDRARERVGHLIELGATSAAPGDAPAPRDAVIPDAPTQSAPGPAGRPSAATLLARELLAGGTPPAEVARRLGEHYGVADPGAVLAAVAPATA